MDRNFNANTSHRVRRRNIKIDVIAILALIVAIIGAIFTIPELRIKFGIDQYPHLQQTYSGTGTFNEQIPFGMKLFVTSQDTKGYIIGKILFDRPQYSICHFKGNVTFDKRITLTCYFSDHKVDFNGSIDQDHIQGYSTSDNLNEANPIYKWDIKASKN